MHKLGISVYPEHSTAEKDAEYMKLAAKYGFSRIFTCLLSVDKPKETIIKEFSSFIETAHKLGYEVAADTNPQVFRHLGASPGDLGVFRDMKLDIIRLDGSFGEVEDRLITRNPWRIRIEFNASSDVGIDHLIRHGADPRNILVCHNFYPERYTGLSMDVFQSFNAKWNGLGLHTAAFVSSNSRNSFGPWPVYAGLPTLEADRGLPIDLQVRHLLSTEMIDDVLIGNAYASDDELKAMSRVDLTGTTILMQPVEDLSPVERQVIQEFRHNGRTDASGYLIRSCQPRTSCRDASIPPRKCRKDKFRRGDVVVVNDNLSHYRGEVEIVLKDLPNDGERNLAGHIPGEEFLILDQMEQRPDHFWDFILR